MRSTLFAYFLSAMLFAFYGFAHGQQQKPPRIAYLIAGSASSISAHIDAFRQGLRDMGYLEGKNIFIEYRYAEGKQDQLPDLAAELVRLKVDLIFTGNTAAALAARKATVTIPIVAVLAGDPVANGLVNSLAKPEGNVTGITRLSTTSQLGGKQLEIFKETFPRISLIAFLWSPDEALGAARDHALTDMQVAAQPFGIRLQSLEVRGPADLDNAFSSITKSHANAIFVRQSSVNNIHEGRIIAYAAKIRLPGMYQRPEAVIAGGLMYYGPDDAALYRRGATYVDKILKGAKPADLPVEQPTKFDFIINLKTAKQIGLTIPPNVLARADRVIR